MHMSSSTPHLLVVTTNYAESGGGVEMHLQSLLPRLVRRGVAVTVVYLGAQRESYVEDSGVRVIPLRRRFDFRNIIALPDPRQWSALVRQLQGGRGGGLPVTHLATHTRFFPLSYLGIRLANRLGVPSIHTEHGGGFVVTTSPLVRFGSMAFDKTVGRAVLRKATVVASVSKVSKEFVSELSGVTSLPFTNGIDVSAWLPALDETPSTDAPRLVFIGRIVAEKGWRVFLDAAASCQRNGWLGETWLIGAGMDLAAAHEYARRLGLTGLVAPGHIPSDEVRDALRGAVYVNPSMASEGFQLTIVEALTAGAGVATYDVGVAPEMALVPGAQIVVVDRGDSAALIAATARLLAQPRPIPTWEQYGAWDWDSVADSYIRIMKGVSRAGAGSESPA
jgi:glycosyltransferase involved in cell wall biosynthesis